MNVDTPRTVPALVLIKDKDYFPVDRWNTPTRAWKLRRQPYYRVVSTELPQRDRAAATKKASWCSKKDVVEAFRAVAEEIRTRCERIKSQGLTQAEACRIALRVRDQRELIRQLTDHHDSPHVRRLLWLNRQLRKHLVALAEQAGLDTRILVLK